MTVTMGEHKEWDSDLLKILIIHPSYPPGWHDGGPVVSVSRMAEELAAAGMQVTVLTSNRDATGRAYCRPGRRTLHGVTVIYSRRWWPWRYCLIPGHLLQAWRLFRWADVVCLMSIFNFTSLCVRLVSLLHRRVPLIVSPRGNLSPVSLRRSRLLKILHGRLVEKPLMRRALFIHCTSSRDKSWAEAYHPGAKCYVVPNGVDAVSVGGRRLPPSVHVAARRKPKRIVYIGRFHPLKNIEALVEAVRSLHEWDVRLLLIGRDDSAYSLKLAHDFECMDNVRLFRFRDRTRALRALAIADIVALPSKSENFGNVVIEALAAGVPVLVSESVGAADIVVRTGAGVVVPPEAIGIANGLRQLLANLEEFQSAAGKAKGVLEEYRWSEVARRFIELCTEALAR